MAARKKEAFDTGAQLATDYQAVQDGFEKALRKTVKRHKDRHIHRMRVSIKKMRAVWAMLAGLDPGLPIESLKALTDDAFAAAGRVREAQVNREIVASHKQQYLSGFHDLLIRQEEQCLEELLLQLDEFDLDRFRKHQHRVVKALQRLDRQTAVTAIGRYIEEELRKTIYQLGHGEDLNLHKVRKHVRNIDTQLQFIGGLDPSNQYAGLKIVLRPFLDQLGTWHDDLVLLEALEHFSRDERNTENELLRHFTTGLRHRLERESIEIAASLARLRDLRDSGPA